MLKSKKGITLIALVITIIVLLILAGIALTAIAGENGIIKRAEQAREQSETAKDKEELQLGMADDYIDMWVTGDTNKYLEAINKLMTTELNIQGIEKLEIKGTENDANININFFVEYNDKFYETYLNIKDSEIESFGPEDLADKMINNLTLSDRSKLKKEHTIMAQAITDNEKFQEIFQEEPKAMMILDFNMPSSQTDVRVNLRVAFEYESELYDFVLYGNEDETSIEALIAVQPSIAEIPELASISTGNCSKYGLDKNGHLWALTSTGYAVNVNKVKNIENVSFTKIAAGKENVLMLDSNRSNMGMWK